VKSAKYAVTVLVLAAFAAPSSAAERRTDHVVLVTLDGARWQEIFGGMDEGVLQATAPSGTDVRTQPIYTRFAGRTPEERRAKLMPFLWNTFVREHGFIAGNRNAGSRVSVTNQHWFSYPGYSEILTGQAHDDTIRSNDPVRNPYPSVLQFLRRKLELPSAKVALFGSWSVFPWIAESREGEITTNAGVQQYSSDDASMRLLNDVMFETTTPWDGVRHDAYTLRFALDYLQRATPRVLYIALGETDDWAHDGRYDRVLESLHRTDRSLREIWDTLQRLPEYRGRTSMLVTVDHGRGRTAADWRNHSIKVPGADEIWFALASPDVERRGEWRDHSPVFQNQFAATLATLLGFDYREQNPEAGKPIETAVVSSERR
jgi:hypothetical protein